MGCTSRIVFDGCHGFIILDGGSSSIGHYARACYRGRIHKRFKQSACGLVVGEHALRVPLDSQDKASSPSFDGFDDAVAGDGRRDKAGSDLPDGLVVKRIDSEALVLDDGSSRLPSFDLDLMGGVPFGRPLGVLQGGAGRRLDVLVEIAPGGDVEHLHPPADAQNRPIDGPNLADQGNLEPASAIGSIRPWSSTALRRSRSGSASPPPGASSPSNSDSLYALAYSGTSFPASTPGIAGKRPEPPGRRDRLHKLRMQKVSVGRRFPKRARDTDPRFHPATPIL